MLLLRDAAFAIAAFGLALAFASWLSPAPQICERVYIGDVIAIGDRCR
jgi:hypothetical protein